MSIDAYFFVIKKLNGEEGLYRVDHKNGKVINFTMAKEIPH